MLKTVVLLLWKSDTFFKAYLMNRGDFTYLFSLNGNLFLTLQMSLLSHLVNLIILVICQLAHNFTFSYAKGDFCLFVCLFLFCFVSL